MAQLKLKHCRFFPGSVPFTFGWYSGGLIISIPFLIIFITRDEAPLIMLTRGPAYCLFISGGELVLHVGKWKKAFPFLNLFGKKTWIEEPAGEMFEIRSTDGIWILRPGIAYYRRSLLPWRKEKLVKGHIRVSSPIELPSYLTFCKKENPMDAIATFADFPRVQRELKREMDSLNDVIDAIPDLVKK